MTHPAGDPVADALDRLERALREARAVPLSASAMVNREELLGLVAELRRALPEALGRATAVLGDKEGVVAEGRSEAERLVEQARAQQAGLVAQTAVHVEAEAEAARIVAEAEAHAEAMRLEVEEYVDAKLANFEVVLGKTLDAVKRGRARLHGETELDALGPDDHPLPGGR